MCREHGRPLATLVFELPFLGLDLEMFQKNLSYVEDLLLCCSRYLSEPPLFAALYDTKGTSWEHMYPWILILFQQKYWYFSDFSMKTCGHSLEVCTAYVFVVKYRIYGKYLDRHA